MPKAKDIKRKTTAKIRHTFKFVVKAIVVAYVKGFINYLFRGKGIYRDGVTLFLWEKIG